MQTIEKHDEYIELLVLAYFKQYKQHYSYADIASKVGLSEAKVSAIISGLLEKNQLAYIDDLLGLTVSGRIKLSSSYLENYVFDANIEIFFEKERWPINKVYVPRSFSEKKWRGKK